MKKKITQETESNIKQTTNEWIYFLAFSTKTFYAVLTSLMYVTYSTGSTSPIFNRYLVKSTNDESYYVTFSIIMLVHFSWDLIFLLAVYSQVTPKFHSGYTG
jgi:hypothetical protein